MNKLTRQAQVLIFAIMISIFLIAAFILFQPESNEEKQTTDVKYTINVVSENQKIMSTYIDAISQEKSSSTYQEFQMTLDAGYQIGDYKLSNKQTFSKYIKAEGPDGKAVLTKKSKQVITHYAYSMLLVGDVVEKINQTTNEKTYEVVNARITYDQIPMVLLSNENSVSLANSNQSKEKIVNLQDFINALKDVKKRDSMIKW